MYTKDGLIQKAKTASDNLMGISLPVVNEFYGDFIQEIGLDHDAYYHIKKYVNGVSYEAKKHLFESLGFKVLYMTLSAIKVIHFAKNKGIHKSIDQEFLDGERNVFIFEIEQGIDILYFVLEYKSPEKLCDFTVDRKKLAREEKQKTEAGSLFKRMLESRLDDKDNFFD